MRRLFYVLAAGSLLAGCADAGNTGTPRDFTAGIDLNVAALNLQGVQDVVWDLQVVNGATPAQIVWNQRISSSQFGNGSGSASYVGPCDADTTGNTYKNEVRIWVVGIYAAAFAVNSVGTFDYGRSIPGTPELFQNPTTKAPGANGAAVTHTDPASYGAPLKRTFNCLENQDVFVQFDVALMRPAQQGFFDIAVNFNNIFCSAKFDCSYPAYGTCTAGACSTGSALRGDLTGGCLVDRDCYITAQGTTATTYDYASETPTCTVTAGNGVCVRGVYTGSAATGCTASSDCSLCDTRSGSATFGKCMDGTVLTTADTDQLCAASTDCKGPQNYIDLLHNSGSTGRDHTYVLGFACTAGATGTNSTKQTQLLLDDLEFDCDGSAGTDFWINTSPANDGNLCSAGFGAMISGGSADACVNINANGSNVWDNTAGSTLASTYIYQAAVYRGKEQLMNGANSYNKVYWNVAIGVKTAISACKLTVKGTADDALNPGDNVSSAGIAADVVYPYLVWNLSLDKTTCTQEPLQFVSGASVATTYTQVGGALLPFDNFYAP